VQDPAPTHGDLINYPAFIEALYQTGYKGYLTSEYCLPVIKNHHLAGIEAVDSRHANYSSLYETTGTAGRAGIG